MMPLGRNTQVPLPPQRRGKEQLPLSPRITRWNRYKGTTARMNPSPACRNTHREAAP